MTLEWQLALTLTVSIYLAAWTACKVADRSTDFMLSIVYLAIGLAGSAWNLHNAITIAVKIFKGE